MWNLVKLNLVVVLLISSICIQFRSIEAIPVENAESALDFILLHNNDLHSHFEEISSDYSDCTPEKASSHQCYGGFDRISSLVKKYRYEYEKENGKPVLFLNAGDTYVGTPWFQIFKDKIVADFMNVLKPDVGALGNHDFDLGVNGLLAFLKNINFSIVATNLNISDDHPLMATNVIKSSDVLNLNSTKVGVIGYILPETKELSMTEDVGILPEIEAINEEAEKLSRQGVNIIIALGHSGYEKDKEIAKDCPLVDVVVGAHSHTFLYTGTPPDPNDIPIGPYPTVVEQKNGKKVPVVQASCYSKYLGKLELSFDKDGNLIRWSGLPILLDDKVPRDPEIIDLLDKYRPGIEALTKDIVTYSKVHLKKDCHNSDCNIGNLITDSWVFQRAKQYHGPGWTDASIAFINAGAIRSSASIGNVSQFSISTILPFNNPLWVGYVPGSVIKKALEFAVWERIVAHFLQMSGVRVVYNVDNKPGHRVYSVEVLCANCSVPKYEPLDEHKAYGIILDSFLWSGDGFTMFEPFPAVDMNITSTDAVISYMRHFESIYPAVEGRIKYYTGENVGNTNASQSATRKLTSLSLAVIATSLLISMNY